MLQVSLNLMENKLDALPSKISHLRNLRELKIEGNQIRNLPAVINEMESLEMIICEDQLMETNHFSNLWKKENGVFRKNKSKA